MEQIGDYSLSGEGYPPLRDEILAIGPPSVMNIGSGPESASDTVSPQKLSFHQ